MQRGMGLFDQSFSKQDIDLQLFVKATAAAILRQHPELSHLNKEEFEKATRIVRIIPKVLETHVVEFATASLLLVMVPTLAILMMKTIQPVKLDELINIFEKDGKMTGDKIFVAALILSFYGLGMTGQMSNLFIMSCAIAAFLFLTSMTFDKLEVMRHEGNDIDFVNKVLKLIIADKPELEAVAVNKVLAAR